MFVGRSCRYLLWIFSVENFGPGLYEVYQDCRSMFSVKTMGRYLIVSVDSLSQDFQSRLSVDIVSKKNRLRFSFEQTAVRADQRVGGRVYDLLSNRLLT